MNDRLVHFLIGFPVAFSLLFATFTLGDIALERYELWKIDRTPRTEYFDYQDISYVKTTDEGITFASTALVKQSYPLAWNDILRCGENTYSFYSVQNTNFDSPVPRTDYRKTEWEYLEPRPAEGTKCIIDSTITMDVMGKSKVQKVESQPFRIGD